MLVQLIEREKERASSHPAYQTYIPELLEEFEAAVEGEEGVADVLLGVLDLLAVDEGGGGVGSFRPCGAR